MEEWALLVALVVAMGAWYAGAVVERVSLRRCAADVTCQCIRSFPEAVFQVASALQKPPDAAPGVAA